MDAYNMALTIGTWLSALSCFINLDYLLVNVALFAVVTFLVCGHCNSLRELRVLLLAEALEELLQRPSLGTVTSSTVPHASREQSLLAIRAQLADLLRLVQARRTDPVWTIVHGSWLDGHLTQFEMVVESAHRNAPGLLTQY